MKRLRSVVVLIGVAILALVPTALAHVEPSARIIQRVADGVVFSVELAEDFARSGVRASGTGWFVTYADGEHPPAPLDELLARGADGSPIRANVTMTAAGHFSFDLAIPARGEWTLEPTLASGERAQLPLTVYPDHPARLAWAEDAEWSFVQLRPARLAFQVDDVAPWRDAVARVEWWADPENGPVASFDIPLESDASGTLLTATRVFNEPGIYVIHVGSIARGLPPGDRPPFRVYVAPAEPAAIETAPTPPTRDTPGAPLAAILGLALAIALARARGPSGVGI